MIERHEEWSDLAPVYVLGGLEAEEVAAFEAHLAHCESCRQEVRELQEVTGFLPLAAEPVAPPPGMRARVLGNVLGHAQESAEAKPAAAPAQPEAPAVLQEDLAPQHEAAQPGQGLPPETAVPAARAEEAAQAQPWQPQGRACAQQPRLAHSERSPRGSGACARHLRRAAARPGRFAEAASCGLINSGRAACSGAGAECAAARAACFIPAACTGNADRRSRQA